MKASERALRLYIVLLPLILLGNAFGDSTRDVQGEILLRAAGMQRNYEAIRDLSVRLVHYQREAGGSVTSDVQIEWVAPGVFRGDLYSNTGGGTEAGIKWGTIRAYSDGKTYRQAAEEPRAARLDYHLVGTVSGATGMSQDMGPFAAYDPRGHVWGMGDARLWKQLENYVARRKVVWARAETHFGADGLAILIRPTQGMERYVWVEDAHGFLPRIWRFTQRLDRKSERTLKLEIPAIEESGGVWFPRVITMTHYDSEIHPDTLYRRWTISSLKINSGLEPRSLRFDFKPGTLVKNEITGERYVVRFSRLGATMLAAMAVGAGCALIGGGWLVVVRRRRRRQQRTKKP
jgi:hypothetical protein